MKKIIAFLLVFALVFPVFADISKADKEDFIKEYNDGKDIYSLITDGFTPVNARMMGMGGAGLALSRIENGIFFNPSTLSSRRFSLSLPSVSATLYHPYAILQNRIFDKVKNGDKIGDIISAAVDVVGSSLAPMARIDVSTGMTLPSGFGLGFYVSDTVNTYSGTLIDELDVSAILGYGQKFSIGDLDISAGVSARYNALVFNKRIKAADIKKAENMNDIAITYAAGWNRDFIPALDAAVTARYNGLGLSFIASDLLASYDMTINRSKVSEFGLDNARDILRDGDFTLNPGNAYSLAFAYEKKLGGIGMAFALDLVDIGDMFSDFSSSSYSKGRIVLAHTRCGLELGLLNTLVVRGGLNGGYWTVGASFDLFVMRVDCAYYWKEMEAASGQRGLDGLTIRFNLGYDR